MSAQPLGPALDDAGHPLDQVVLTGISATGHHGVFEHERREGQTFVADVVVHLDTRRAAATDDLTRTVHYGELAEHVAAVLAGEPADLVETVAERIAATVLANPVVAAVDVTVHKPEAPITVPFGDVAVRVRRDRQKLPAAEPWAPPRAPAAAGTGAGSGADAGPDSRAVHAAVTGPVAAPAGPADAVAAAEPDRLDEVPPVPVDAVLALGSNLGAPQSTLRAAVADVAALDGVEVVAVSPLARTAPVGGPSQPDFLNAVVLVRTTLSARGLLHAAQSVESRHGRERDERWGPRTLDVDLITYDSTLAVTDDLELPHPRAHERAFVLQPWAQVAPDAVLPGLGGGPVAALAATAPDRDGIRWLALDWMSAPAHRGPASATDEPPTGAPAAPVPGGGAPPVAAAGRGDDRARAGHEADTVGDDAGSAGGAGGGDDAVRPAGPGDEAVRPTGPGPGGAHAMSREPADPPADGPLDWLPELPSRPAPADRGGERPAIFSPVVPPSGETPRVGGPGQ